ncbi:MAG: hypothetical protein K2L02_06185 [Clostridia bacterium]|nr:hypothetical protein [Clostridia bacterium]
MEFAESLPKTNAPKEEEGELNFCSIEEGVREIVKTRPSGKSLFVADGDALCAFRTCLPPRSLSLVLDSEDCLPLFLSSDDAPFVAAAGKRSTLVAARFFAEIRKIPCILFPVSAALDGAFEDFGEVLIENKRERVPLKAAKICCDRELMRPTVGQAYMRLLLSRLALIEAKAMRRFGAEIGREKAEERAFQTLLSLRSETLGFEEVVQKNAEIRRCERDGMNAGEGVILSGSIGLDGEEQAFLMLAALYSAFFEKGKPHLCVPDYEARARNANASYAAQNIPTAQEFFHRAALFERIRADACRELNAFLSGLIHYKNNYFSLTNQPLPAVRRLSLLKVLPERSAGLSSVIRDFGLMEWDESAFK